MLEVHVSATEWETAWELLPDREMVSGELVALLATVTLPEKFPAASGVNVASSNEDCPGARIKPADTPLVEKCAPEIVTFDTVTSEFPAFVRVTLKTSLFPTATSPKFKPEELAVRSAVCAIPIPLTETVLGALEMSLAMETIPDNAPAAFGEYATSNVTSFPGAMTMGRPIPLIVIPAAVALAFVMVRFDPPPFDILTV